MVMLIIGLVHAALRVFFRKGAFYDPALAVRVARSVVADMSQKLADHRLGVGVFGLTVYAMIAYVIVRTQIPARQTISILAWLPWAVPGILLGVALLWLLLSLPGMSFIYGTFVPLILVLIVKEMPIGTHMMKAALGQISRELEEASWACGAGRFTTFWRISLPLVTPTLISIFAIVLIGALRDISTTILLVTAKTRPLSDSHAGIFPRRPAGSRLDHRRADYDSGNRHGDGGAPLRLEDGHRIISEKTEIATQLCRCTDGCGLHRIIVTTAQLD